MSGARAALLSQAPRPGAAAGWQESRRLAARLVTFSVVLLAFNDLPGLLPIGEMSQDAFIYAVPLLALYLMRSDGGLALPASLLGFSLAFAAVVLLGVAENYQEIIGAQFKGRSGFGRVVTQAMTFGFGIVVALLFFSVALRGLLALVVRGARLAVLIMAAVGFLEFASWYNLPGLTQLHQALGSVIHAHSGIEYPERLRTTAFEVSWAGVMLTFFFPFATTDLGGRKLVLAGYAALILLLVMLAQSRTAMLVIGSQAVVLAWFHLRFRMDLVVHALAAGSVALLLLMTSASVREAVGEKLSNMIEYGSFSPTEELAEANVSNITRAASVKAGFSMFAERPLLGVGFGQFGFHYGAHLDADDFRSYEVRDYVTDSEDTYWPPAYSIHARLLAETGLAGYVIWAGSVVVLTARSFRAAFGRTAPAGLRGVHLAVAMTLAGALLLGASIDSFRFFGGWIAWGLALGLAARSRIRSAE